MSKIYCWYYKVIGILFLTISSILYGAGILSFIIVYFAYVIGLFLFDFGCYLQYTKQEGENMSTKVYLVVQSSGEYDDYREHISAAYFDKQKAIDVVEAFNQKLAIDKEQFKKCMNCRIYDEILDDEESEQAFIKQMKIECPESDIHIDEEKFINCKSEPSHYVDDMYDAVIRELDVE